MKRPKVSIVMVVYNQRPDWFELALTSCLRQSLDECQVVVSGVTGDPALERAREKSKFYPGKMTVLENMYANRVDQLNAAFKVCEGEYIIRCDSDDKFYPYAVEAMLYVATTKNSLLIYPRFEYCDDDLQVIDVFQPPAEFSMPALRKMCYITESSMIKKETLWEFGLYDRRWEKFAAWNLWLQIAGKYPTRIHNYAGNAFRYRRHDNALGRRFVGEELRQQFYNHHGLTESVMEPMLALQKVEGIEAWSL